MISRYVMYNISLHSCFVFFVEMENIVPLHSNNGSHSRAQCKAKGLPHD
jgi:hypothetical protein